MTLCPQLRRLEEEHARWLREVAGRTGEGGCGAARLLALWDDEILPHCRVEEEVLLPELARRIPEADALIVFTLGDHVALRRLARDLRAAAGEAAREAAARLGAKLAEHLAFEERTLLPALQEEIGSGRLAALGRELAARDGNHPVDGPPVRREGRRKGRKP